MNVAISKEVDRVEGNFNCSGDDDQPTDDMCHLLLRTQTGRTESEKEAFREELERLAGLSDGQTMLCALGDFNAHIGVVEPGDEESIGRFGWGTRNRKGRELVDILRRNVLAIAGTFF